MANPKLITFYISQVVEPIKRKMNQDAEGVGLEADYTNEMIDTLLKHHFKLDKSKIEMSNFELQELIEWSFQFGDMIGLTLNYPKSELDELLNFKDLK